MEQVKNNKFAGPANSSIEQMTNRLLQNKNTGIIKQLPDSLMSFEEVLQKKQEIGTNSELKFSKHANERLHSRNIDLSSAQLKRLESGAKRASEKGIKESLVMVDNLAFIVNVKNNTVITAVNDGDDRVFTNIDGAVII